MVKYSDLMNQCIDIYLSCDDVFDYFEMLDECPIATHSDPFENIREWLLHEKFEDLLDGIKEGVKSVGGDVRVETLSKIARLYKSYMEWLNANQ